MQQNKFFSTKIKKRKLQKKVNDWKKNKKNMPKI